ncbi:MAG: flagellar M-ring protein FliF, partial [Hydrogenimonas sp.]
PFATIQRITAAVVVDGKYTHDETGAVTYEPRSSEELEQITELVKQAIGYDPQRGDQVTVSNFKFEGMAQKEFATPYESALSTLYTYVSPIEPLLKYLLLLVILFVFYKKVIVPFSEKMLEVPVEEPQEKEPYIDIDEEEHESLTEKFSEMRKKVEEQLGFTEGMNEEELKYDVLLEKVKDMAEGKPEELALLITALVRDESEIEQKTATQMTTKETS